MSVTYENVAYDRVLKGVEKILEDNFSDKVQIYLSEEYEDYPDRQSIRLWYLTTEQISRETASATDVYPVEVSIYVPVARGARRKINDEMAELTARVKRLLRDNRTYRLANGTYQWHDGTVEVDPDPEREEEAEGRRGEPSPEVMSMSKILFNVTATEIL